MPLENLNDGLENSGLSELTSVKTLGFETGNLSQWDTVNDLQVVTNRVYQGTYSGFSTNAQSGTFQARTEVYPNGNQPDKFEYFYQITKNGFGQAVRLWDGNGNPICGSGDNNNEWFVYSDVGVSNLGVSPSANQWLRHSFYFDWENGNFDIDFEALGTGDTYTDLNLPLSANASPVVALEIEDYNNGNFKDGGDIDTWFDEFRIR